MKKKRIIFFDWDGTIVSPKLAEIGNIERTKTITSQIDKNDLLKLQRDNKDNHYKLIQDYIKSITGIENIDEIKRLQVYLFTFYYLKNFRKNPNEFLLINLEELKKLKKKYDLKLIVITGLFKEIIDSALRTIDSKKEIFDDFCGIENNLKGDKKEFITKMIKKYSNYEPLVMIGDKQSDIEPGIYHNLKTIFCNYGHGSSKDADITIEEPIELIDAIEKLLKNKD